MNKTIYITLLLSSMLFLQTGCNENPKKDRITTTKVKTRILSPKNGETIKKGENLSLTATINTEEIKSYTITVNDSIVTNVPNVVENVKFTINAEVFYLGANKIILKTENKDGSFTSDTRKISVLSNKAPELIDAEAVTAYPHLTSSYTQGLEFFKGELYEGTGQYGSSKLAKIDLKTGKEIKKIDLSNQFFGEGITILDNKIYQLTWKAQKGFIYDLTTLEKIGQFLYNSEGWGLTNNGTSLIMSDGSERLYFRNPITFEIEKQIEVYTNNGALSNLNELEFINGKIYANIYTTNKIAVINPDNGIVEKIIDASLLALDYRENGEVLNGIAYNTETEKLYVTGKNWPSLIEIKLY